MTTIQDVARLAHVSVSSVSNVLNGKADRMRPETYTRIEEAIRKLGYRPNQAARQLKTGRSPILGLLVPTTANPFFGQLAMSMETYAQQQYGHRVLLCNTHRDKRLEAAMFDDLIAFGVRAVIVVSSLSDEQHIEAAMARGLAVISFDLGPDPGSVIRHDYVLPDNVAAGTLAARHLIEYGHSHLAFAMPKGLTYSRRQKIEGFMAAIDQESGKASGRVVEGKSLTRYGDTELASMGYDMAATIVNMDPRPTGVVTVNDMMAVGLMAGIRDQGLLIPDDMSIVGMDDLTLSAFTWPPLTSICMPMQAMSCTMVDRAVARIAQPDLEAEEICFEPTLAIRKSVAAPSTGRHQSRPGSR